MPSLDGAGRESIKVQRDEAWATDVAKGNPGAIIPYIGRVVIGRPNICVLVPCSQKILSDMFSAGGLMAKYGWDSLGGFSETHSFVCLADPVMSGPEDLALFIRDLRAALPISVRRHEEVDRLWANVLRPYSVQEEG